MKTAIIVLLFLSCMYTNAQECKCRPVKIIVYDFNNAAAKPLWYKGEDVVSTTDHTREQIAEFVDWQHAPQEGANSFIEVAKNGSSELEFIAANVKVGSGGTSATTGAVFAPSGEIKSVDYIVTGEFIRAGDHFILQVHLEDAITRDRFGEESTEIPLLKNAIEAGKQVAAQLSPLLETIRKYQVTVRDEKRTDETAIGARYEVTADNTDLKKEETTTVKLKMYDCYDKAPLKNRKVTMKSDGGGTFSPAEITTDDNGEATTTFKAGKKAEEVSVYPEYQYENVTHKKSWAVVCGKELHIKIAGTYKLKVEFEAAGQGDGGKFHALVKGDTEVKLLQEDSCYSVELVNGDQMQFQVKEVVFKSDDGYATYESPQTFEVPITVSLTDCKNPKFKIAFSRFGDAGETYSTPGKHFAAPILYSLAYATLSSVNLGRLQSQAENLKEKAQQFEGKEAQVDAAAKRLNAHQNDPNYLKTPQGKADMALMQQMAKTMGYDPNKIRPDPKRMQNLENLKQQNALQAQINAKMRTPGYIGSEQYVQDQQALGRIASKVNLASLGAAAGMDINIMQIEAPFNPNADKPVDKIQKDQIKAQGGVAKGWDYGQFHITIEKD